MAEPQERFKEVFAVAGIPVKPFGPWGVPIIQDGCVGILSRDGNKVFVGVRRDLHADELPKLIRATAALRAVLLVFPWDARTVQVEATLDVEVAAQNVVCVIHRTNGVTYIEWRRPGTEGTHHVERDKALETINAP